MKCRRARKLIYDFIDGMIGDQDRIALETHLGDCPSCEAMASGLSKSLDLLHRVPQVEPDDNFNWKVRLAVQQAKNSVAADVTYTRTWIRSWNTRFALSAAATFLVICTAGYFVTKPYFTPAGNGPLATFSQPVSPAGQPTDERNGFTPVDHSGPGLGSGLVVGPTLTSTSGPNPTTPGTGLISEATEINADSLTSHFLRSRIAAEKMRRLQQQVDVLQSELRNCESED